MTTTADRGFHTDEHIVHLALGDVHTRRFGAPTSANDEVPR